MSQSWLDADNVPLGVGDEVTVLSLPCRDSCGVVERLAVSKVHVRLTQAPWESDVGRLLPVDPRDLCHGRHPSGERDTAQLRAAMERMESQVRQQVLGGRPQCSPGITIEHYGGQWWRAYATWQPEDRSSDLYLWGKLELPPRGVHGDPSDDQLTAALDLLKEGIERLGVRWGLVARGCRERPRLQYRPEGFLNTRELWEPWLAAGGRDLLIAHARRLGWGLEGPLSHPELLPDDVRLRPCVPITEEAP